MGEGNDKQTDLESGDATNHYLRLDPPCIQPWGYRNHGNIHHAWSPAIRKVVRSFVLLEIHQANTWNIVEKDPQNISSMEHPAFRLKFL